MIICAGCGNVYSDINPVIVFTQKHRKNISWFKCSKCKTFFTIPYVEAEEEADHSRKFAYGNKNTAIHTGNKKEKLFKQILNILNERLGCAGKVLDHGSSYGAFCFLAREKGYSLVPMDILPEAIAYLKGHGFYGEVSSSVNNTQVIGKEKFNAVVAVDSCYYWRNMLEEFKNINNILLPSGLLVIRTSEKYWMFNLGVLLKVFFGYEVFLKKSVYDHLSVVPLKTLCSFLSLSGYDVVQVSSVKAIPSGGASLIAVLQYYLGEFLYKFFRVSFSSGFLICAVKSSK